MAEYQPFRPALEGRLLERFARSAQDLTSYPPDDRDDVIQREITWAASQLGRHPQAAVYKAVWCLIKDLMRAGWACRWSEATFQVAPPSNRLHAHGDEAIQAFKARCRALYAESRARALEEARDFILSMERRRPPLGSIVDVLADGAALAADLQHVKSIQDEDAQLRALANAVQPYLQLIESNARCQFTGLRLSDIWRYFRLTWAIPRYNTPGRSLFYLVRDRARPNHPVMGILSFENAPIFISDRDNYVGWSVDAFVQNLERIAQQHDARDRIRDEFLFLVRAATEASALITVDDLCTEQERTEPTEHVVQRLLTIAAQASSERAAALQRWRDQEIEIEDERDRQVSEYGSVSQRAQVELFRKKRANELARLLSAQITLNRLLESSTWADEWRDFTVSERGRTAIRMALRAIKNQHIGSSILELNICGAVPPYNHILGGKLAALLALSPEVVCDYRLRYGDAVSQIATQLQGEPVVRPAELVYLGTTSLYRAGASQYNRLRLPEGLFGNDSPAMAYHLIGETSGFGTLHISDETTRALEDAVDTGYLEVNHVMGEGVSPKFRIIRRGIDKIMAPNQRELTDEIMRHGVNRLVYGMPIAANAQAYLQGRVDTPIYPWPSTMTPEEGTFRIADYWRRRWLRQRLSFAPAIQRIAAWTPQDVLLSRSLSAESAVSDEAILTAVQMALSDLNGSRERTLVRDLYRGSTSFSDDVPLEDLRLLHAETRLDSEILSHVRAGRSVVLTGNPGDGKTHLLRILADDMGSDVVVERDASAVSNDEVYAHWKDAHDRGVPYALAINEAVLFRLADLYEDFQPLRDARHQVQNAIGYGATEAVDTSQVVVFDLSLRNPLSPGVVGPILDRLTDEAPIPHCGICPVGGCGFVHNRDLLRQQRVRERLQDIFDRITRRGQHITMRDVQAFVSYLLFGDRTCEQLVGTQDNARYALPQLVYSGKGQLFGAAKETFDPIKVAHPQLDDALVVGSSDIDPAGWLAGSSVPRVSLDPTQVEEFHRRKRAFYFFHKDGNRLLGMGNDDERLFFEFLNMPQREALRNIVQKLNMFFGQAGNADRIRVWQYHRYDQSAQQVLYAVETRRRGDLEIVGPVLTPHMAAAYDLAVDHVLLRLKEASGTRARVSLRIDYELFHTLLQAERGLPLLQLQPPVARRIWQFVEQLAQGRQDGDDYGEREIDIYDPVSSERLRVTVDVQSGQYISINEMDEADSV